MRYGLEVDVINNHRDTRLAGCRGIGMDRQAVLGREGMQVMEDAPEFLADEDPGRVRVDAVSGTPAGDVRRVTVCPVDPYAGMATVAANIPEDHGIAVGRSPTAKVSHDIHMVRDASGRRDLNHGNVGYLSELPSGDGQKGGSARSLYGGRAGQPNLDSVHPENGDRVPARCEGHGDYGMRVIRPDDSSAAQILGRARDVEDFRPLGGPGSGEPIDTRADDNRAAGRKDAAEQPNASCVPCELVVKGVVDGTGRKRVERFLDPARCGPGRVRPEVRATVCYRRTAISNTDRAHRHPRERDHVGRSDLVPRGYRANGAVSLLAEELACSTSIPREPDRYP